MRVAQSSSTPNFAYLLCIVFISKPTTSHATQSSFFRDCQCSCRSSSRLTRFEHPWAHSTRTSFDRSASSRSQLGRRTQNGFAAPNAFFSIFSIRTHRGVSNLAMALEMSLEFANAGVAPIEFGNIDVNYPLLVCSIQFSTPLHGNWNQHL